MFLVKILVLVVIGGALVFYNAISEKWQSTTQTGENPDPLVVSSLGASLLRQYDNPDYKLAFTYPKSCKRLSGSVDAPGYKTVNIIDCGERKMVIKALDLDIYDNMTLIDIANRETSDSGIDHSITETKLYYEPAVLAKTTGSEKLYIYFVRVPSLSTVLQISLPESLRPAITFRSVKQ